MITIVFIVLTVSLLKKSNTNYDKKCNFCISNFTCCPIENCTCNVCDPIDCFEGKTECCLRRNSYCQECLDTCYRTITRCSGQWPEVVCSDRNESYACNCRQATTMLCKSKECGICTYIGLRNDWSCQIKKICDAKENLQDCMQEVCK